MHLTFRGRRVLILGGGCAIGLDLIGKLGETGLTIIPTHASSAGKAALAERFPDLARRSPHLDLADPASVDALEREADYVVDLAHARFEALMAAAEADTYFTAQISGRQRLLRHLGRAMLARRFGRLIHVSSTAACLPAEGQGFYSAAKRAGEALYHALGLELGERGVTSVSLRLGLLDAGRGAEFLDTANRRATLKAPLVTTEQAASTLLFLMSDQALAFTCTTLTMDAGLTAHKYI